MNFVKFSTILAENISFWEIFQGFMAMFAFDHDKNQFFWVPEGNFYAKTRGCGAGTRGSALPAIARVRGFNPRVLASPRGRGAGSRLNPPP